MNQAQDQQLVFRAIGYLPGRLNQLEDGRYALTSSCGDLPIIALQPALKKWLSNNPETSTGLWRLYPRTNRDGQLQAVVLSGFCDSIPEDWTDRQILIAGRIVFQGEGKIALRVERNIMPPKGMEKHPAFNPFTLTIHGFLPAPALGEFWQIDCCFEGGRVELIDANKLGDAELRPTVKQKRKPIAKPIKKQKVAA